jgi:3-hydroxyacyl-CoA dehydrogenase/enoyl-CoA hydratase/3-hydroxybutyryl-CoA epimerase
LEEGVAVQSIDAVAKQFGMPMGPLELADTVGLDICLHVGENLSAAFGGEVPMILRQKVAQKRLGRKTNGGFYAYKAGKLITPKADGRGMAPSDIRDRMLLRMLNEAIACLREGVVSDADLIDVGMVFGTGFAPFRGGPLNYARDRGAAEILDCMQRLESLHGPRFSADAGWSDL